MDLKTLLGDELFTQVSTVLTSNPDVTILLDSKKESNYLPKVRFDEVNTQRKQYKEQNDQFVKDIEKMKVSVTGNEKLTLELEQYKLKLEATEKAMSGVKMDARISSAIQLDKAKNEKLVASLIDKSKLSLNDKGEVEGLTEQLKALKESDSYLFTIEVPPVVPPVIPPNENIPGGTGSIGGQGAGDKGKAESIGAMLAKQKSEAHKSSNPSNFFGEQ